MRVLWIAPALVLLTYYDCLLHFLPQTLLRRATRSTSPTPVAVSSGPLNSIVSAVERAASVHPLRPRCLPQALTAATMLRWAGEQPLVVIGVTRNGTTLDAHAWVEVGGQANDASRPAFVPLAEMR
jgi:hypothetical protein